MIDWEAEHYTPQYRDWGVDATLTPKATGIPVTLRMIDETAGVVVEASVGGQRQLSPVSIPTVQPCACVRRSELTEKSIADVALIGGAVVINGSTYEVKSLRPVPGGDGETSGEVRLVLMGEP